MPGIAASIKLTWLLGLDPKSVGDEENNLDFELT